MKKIIIFLTLIFTECFSEKRLSSFANNKEDGFSISLQHMNIKHIKMLFYLSAMGWVLIPSNTYL